MKMMNRFNSSFNKKRKVRRRSLKSGSILSSSAYMNRRGADYDDDFILKKTQKKAKIEKNGGIAKKGKKMSKSVLRDTKFLSNLLKKSKRSRVKQDRLRNHTKNEILVDRASRIIKNLKGYLEKNGEVQQMLPVQNNVVFRTQKTVDKPLRAGYGKKRDEVRRPPSRNMGEGKFENCQLKLELAQKMNEIFDLKEENGVLRSKLEESEQACSRFKRGYEELSAKYRNLARTAGKSISKSSICMNSPFRDLTKSGEDKENFETGSNCFKKKIKRISIDPKNLPAFSGDSPEFDFGSNKYSAKSSDQCLIDNIQDLSSIEHTKSQSIAHNLIPLLEQKVKNTEKQHNKEISSIHMVTRKVTGNVERLLIKLGLEDMMMLRSEGRLSPSHSGSPLIGDVSRMEGMVRSLKIVFKHVIDREIEERLLEFEGDILRNMNYHDTKIGILRQKILKLNSVVLKQKILKKKKENSLKANELLSAEGSLSSVKSLLESILTIFPRVEKISEKMKKILEEVQSVKHESKLEDPLIQGRFDIIIFTLEQLSQKFEETSLKLEEFKHLTSSKNNPFY